MEGRLPGYFNKEDRGACAAAEIATLRQELTAAKARIQEAGPAQRNRGGALPRDLPKD
jgi:hypothetical protein